MSMRSRNASSSLPVAGHRHRLQQWWLDRSVRAKGLIVVAVPLITLVAITLANLLLQDYERHQRSVAIAASALSSSADQVLADAINAETAVRGYAATSDPLFLAPYHFLLARIGADRMLLRDAAATEGDSAQQREVNATTGKAFFELAQLRSAVSSGVRHTILVPVLKAEKATMDRLRRQVADLGRGPAAVLVAQRANITSLESTIGVLDVAGLALGLLAGLAGVALFTSGVSRRIAAAAANADRLGEGQPLELVGRSADDLGRLADSQVRAAELIAGRAARRDRPRLALLASIVESSDDAIVSNSIDGLITSWNPAAERIYGYPAEEAVGQDGLFVLDGDLRREESEILSAFVASQSSNGGNHSLNRETVQRRKDGTKFPASVTVTAVRDDDGSLIGTSSIARDITKQQRAAAELRSRMDDLERVNHNLETFTYSVSHDLRAPLRSLAGFSSALMEDCGDDLGDVGREYAERIQGASERMAALIEDLLTLSRLWRTETQEVQAVDLSAEVARIADELQLSAPDRHVQFTIQDAVWAPADRVLIRSVLENLIGNAWKFTSRRENASIEFGTMPVQDAGICCYVRDNGAGFDPAYVDKLFAPFERLHSTNEFAGTGVGLASVLQIVERHGGRAWAEGAVGKGATFYFTLDAKGSA